MAKSCAAKLSDCFAAVRAVMGCNTLPPSPPDFSVPPNYLQILNPGVLYVYDIDSNCSGCVTAINLCYRPSADTTNTNERILTAVLINSDRIIVYTHDVYVNPVSDKHPGNCMPPGPSCCVTQTLQPFEKFFVSGQATDLGLRTYSGVSSPLRTNIDINGGWEKAHRQYNIGLSVEDEDLQGMVHLPMFYFNITSGEVT